MFLSSTLPAVSHPSVVVFGSLPGWAKGHLSRASLCDVFLLHLTIHVGSSAKSSQSLLRCLQCSGSYGICILCIPLPGTLCVLLAPQDHHLHVLSLLLERSGVGWGNERSHCIWEATLNITVVVSLCCASSSHGCLSPSSLLANLSGSFLLSSFKFYFIGSGCLCCLNSFLVGCHSLIDHASKLL